MTNEWSAVIIIVIMSNGNRTELSPIWFVIMSDLKNWMIPEQESDMLITS